ncbi:xylulokinase [Ruegeria hyattellae]|uniref:xylulokinase n=1 Tax=Ruegeria hyattellae TaxID=3233337 RepID=UPI00355B0EC5
MIFAGIDLGTSGIKIALVDEEGVCLASAARPSPVDIPHVGWSQQEPDQWWRLSRDIFDELAAAHPALMSQLKGISLSGHMLGPVLLDKAKRPTTPCILWNDQRSILECAELLAKVPDIGWRTNGQPDPGLGAPKLLWLAKHRSADFEAADILMLPKDYVVLQLTGETTTEHSDASGTMLLDCATCDWDDELLAAAGWDRARLPPLLQSCDVAGQLKPELCNRWKTPSVVLVAAGSGDNYAAALGVGAAVSGRAALSIGTSGVLCAADDVFHPAPEQAILTTPHAAPGLFLSMGVVMSAAQSLDWLSRLTSVSAPDLAAMAKTRAVKGIADLPISRPSVTGVRTPDNRPDAQAFLGGLTAGHEASDVAYAILEGVAMQFYAAYTAQKAADVPIDTLTAVGGGTRSVFWVSLIATLFDTEISIPKQGDISACLGAARMAQAAVDPAERDAILSRKNETKAIAPPIASLREQLFERYQQHRSLPFSVV